MSIDLVLRLRDAERTYEFAPWVHALLQEAATEITGYDHSFALFDNANRALMEAWKRAHPESKVAMPDMTKCNEWAVAEMAALVERLTRAEQHVWTVETEVARLKSGKFTAEEIQAFCHDLHGTVDAQAFANGCAEEQRRLYDYAPDRDAVTILMRRLEDRSRQCHEAEQARTTTYEGRHGTSLGTTHNWTTCPSAPCVDDRLFLQQLSRCLP